MTNRRTAPWILAALIVIAAILVIVFQPGGGLEGENPALAAWGLAIPIVNAVTAAIIASRSPGNRVAWVLFFVAFGFLHLLVTPWNEQSLEPVAFDNLDFVMISLTRVEIWVIFFLPLFLLPYLFPTGKFLTRGSSWISAIAIGWAMLVVVLAVFSEEAWVGYGDRSEASWTVSSEFGFVPTAWMEPVSLAFTLYLMVVGVGGVVSMVRRYRRADLTERTQIRWLLYALTLAILGPVLVVFGALTWGGNAVVGFGLINGGLLVPIAITIAITQYRLFDIDRVISRTVAYAIVVGVLGLVFAAGVVWLPQLLGITSDSPLFVAATTLVVFASFNPLRKRVLEAVDRRFNRSRYEARLVEERFAVELQSAHDREELSEALLTTVSDSLSPQATGIWLRSEDRSVKIVEHTVSVDPHRTVEGSE